MSSSDTIKWIDLRDQMHPARLKVGLLAGDEGRQRTILFLMGIKPDSPRWIMAIERLGFRPSATRKYLMRVRGDDEPRTITPAMFHPVWPNAQAAMMERKDAVLDLNAVRKTRLTEEPRTPDETRAAVETGTIRRLGRNAEGDEVFASSTGRFVLHANGQRTIEGRLMRPEMVLRAPDEQALDRCADGFVQAMLQGEVQHSENLDDFLLAVLDREAPYTADEYGSVQTVIDAAMVRFLHGSYETASEAFGDARLLYDHLPAYRGPQRGEAAMPLPLSVIAQRLLGDTKGLRVAVPQPWDGASFAFFPPGTEILAAGHEGSLSRHAAGVRVPDVRWLDARAPELHHDLDGLFFNADPAYGTDGSREDLVRAMTTLRGLKPGGRAVLVLAAGAVSGEITPDERAFFGAIARRYDVESAMQLPEALTRKLGSGACLRLISLRNRPPVAHSLRLDSFKVVPGWDALKSEVDEVLATAKVREAESESIDVARAAQENNFQRPYVAFSKVSEPRTMVPANLQEPLQAALAAVEHVHGPVDGFVERSLGFGPHTLGRRLSAEQVDALALLLHRAMQGRGMIIGDETGIGKGRQLAGAAVFASKQACPVVFITDRANLFSDFVRDLRDIDEWGRFRPLITNSDGTIVDVFTNEVVVDKPDPKVLSRAMEEGLKPADLGVNLIFTTYSQISGEDSRKADWLREIIPDCLLVVDEAHVAAGSDSNISRAIVDLTTAARYVAYSSATWAKTSENLHVYSRAMPESINVSSLAQTMRQGGEAFSELFSSMLARDGAFIRREHDLSKVDFVVEIDDENRVRNEMLSDRVSEVLAAMTFVGGEINKLLARLNDDTVKILKRARAARVGDEGGNTPQGRHAGGAAEGRIFRSSFGAGSVLYQVMRRSLAVMNADNVARTAIRDVAENRKPVIIFDDTGEAFVRRIVQREMIPGVDGERPSLPEAVNAPTIRDLLRNVIQRLGVISYDKVTDNDVAGAERAARRANTGAAEADAAAQADEAVDIDAVLEQEEVARREERVLVIEDLPGMSPQQAEEYRAGMERILQMIEAMPALPLNAIDVVQARLADAGISFGEISGRQLRLVAPESARGESIDSPAWSEAKWQLQRRDKRKRTVNATVHGFNNGELDAVCINRSAATGTSLHASPRFADTRQRVIVELQIPEDPTNRIQLYGRVNRFDQVITPVIRMCTTGIYGEVRALMMQNKKLARLSANVRSSRENAAEFKSIPDLLNTVGRDVCKRFLLDNGGIRSRLGITDADLERPQFDAAARLTSRVALLKVSEQRTVYDEITEMYNDEIARYELSGENPLKPREFDWGAKLADREIVTGIDMEGLGSTFDGPVFLTRVKWQTELKPIVPEQAFAMAAANARKLVDGGVARESTFDEFQAVLDMRRSGQDAIDQAAAAQQNPAGQPPAAEVPDRADEPRQAEVDREVAHDSQDEHASAQEDPRATFLMQPSYVGMEPGGLLPQRLALGEPEPSEVALAFAPDGATVRMDLPAALEELAEDADEEGQRDPARVQWLRAAQQVPIVSLEPIARRLAKILEAKMILELPGTRFADVQAALAAEGTNGVKRLDVQRRWVLQSLPAIVPGALVDAPIEKKGKKTGMFQMPTYLVLDLKLPPKGKEHNLSRWKFEVIEAGDEKPRVISLATLMDELDQTTVNFRGQVATFVVGGWRPQAHVHDAELARRPTGTGADNGWEVLRLLRSFDWMPMGRRTMTAHVLDGNMYMASEWAAATRMGAGVVYSDDQGVRHRGVMLHKSMLNRHGDLASDLPVRLWSPEMIGNFMWRLWDNAVSEQGRRGQGTGQEQTVALGDDAFDPAILVDAVAAGVEAGEHAPEQAPALDAEQAAAEPLSPAEAQRQERDRVLRQFIPQNGPAQTYFFNTDLRVAMKGTGGFTASTEKKPVVALRPGDCLMLSVPKVDAHRIDRALKAEAKRAFMAAHPNSRSYTPEALAQAKASFLWPELRGGGAKKGGRSSKGMAAIRIPVKDEAQLRGAAEMIARAAGIELYLHRGSLLGHLAQAVQEQYFEAKKEALRVRLEAIRVQSQQQAVAEVSSDTGATAHRAEEVRADSQLAEAGQGGFEPDTDELETTVPTA